MEVKIDGEAVNKYISDAILSSILGEGLAKAINKHANDWLTSYDSPLKKVFYEVAHKIISDEMNKEENLAKIRESISNLFKNEVLERIIGKIVSKYMEEVKNGY